MREKMHQIIVENVSRKQLFESASYKFYHVYMFLPQGL